MFRILGIPSCIKDCSILWRSRFLKESLGRVWEAKALPLLGSPHKRKHPSELMGLFSLKYARIMQASLCTTYVYYKLGGELPLSGKVRFRQTNHDEKIWSDTSGCDLLWQTIHHALPDDIKAKWNQPAISRVTQRADVKPTENTQQEPIGKEEKTNDTQSMDR